MTRVRGEWGTLRNDVETCNGCEARIDCLGDDLARTATHVIQAAWKSDPAYHLTSVGARLFNQRITPFRRLRKSGEEYVFRARDNPVPASPCSRIFLYLPQSAPARSGRNVAHVFVWRVNVEDVPVPGRWGRIIDHRDIQYRGPATGDRGIKRRPKFGRPMKCGVPRRRMPWQCLRSRVLWSRSPAIRETSYRK